MAQTESAAAELMAERGQPVPLSEIVAHLRAKDVPLPEKNEKNVASARLSNSKRFVGRRGIGWWFANRPWPGEMEMLSGPKETEAPEGTSAREALAYLDE